MRQVSALIIKTPSKHPMNFPNKYHGITNPYCGHTNYLDALRTWPGALLARPPLPFAGGGGAAPLLLPADPTVAAFRGGVAGGVLSRDRGGVAPRPSGTSTRSPGRLPFNAGGMP